MKKILCILMCLVTLIAFAACTPGEQPVETTGNQTTTNQTDAPPAEDLPEAFTGMYTKENAAGAECFVICDNNQVLKFGQTYMLPTISNDGKYLVYMEMSEQQTNLYVRQAQGEPVLLLENVFVYEYDSSTGVLLAEGDEGVFYTKDLTTPVIKIADLDASLNNSTFIVSADGNYLYVRNPKNQLYRVDLTNNFAISELGQAGRCKTYLVSADEIFYLPESLESKAYIITADGTLNKMDYESYHLQNNILVVKDGTQKCSYIFSKQYGLLSLETDNVDAIISENGKYVAYADSSKVHCFEITADGLTNEKTVDGTYKVHEVSDSGAVLLTNKDDNSFGIWEDSAVRVLSKLDINKGTAAFVDDTVYYICGNQLYSCKNAQEPEVIATGVADYTVLDSGCYYIDADNDLFLVGSDNVVDTEVSSVSAY